VEWHALADPETLNLPAMTGAGHQGAGQSREARQRRQLSYSSVCEHALRRGAGGKERNMKEPDLRRLERLMAAVALTVAAPMGSALAASLNPSQIGSACPAGTTGTWHFVNNQTNGAAAGLLTAVFADAADACVVGPVTPIHRNNQHFYCTGVGGPLSRASTNLPGNLVLSDLTCTTAPPPPPPPPPPCEPKDPKCNPPPPPPPK